MLCSSSGGDLVLLPVILLSTLLFLSSPVSEARTVEEHGVGRSLDDELARTVEADPEAYWSWVTGVWREHIQELSDIVLKQWKRNVGGDLKKIGVSQKCDDVLQYMIRQPMEEEWTARIIDSMKLFPPGILSGTTTELGDYDQCLAVDGHFRGDRFVGKYCLATVNLPKRRLFAPFNFTNRSDLLKPAWIGKVLEQWHNNDNWYALTTAVCFPSLCQSQEIRSIAKAYYPILNSFDFNVTYCQARGERQSYHPAIWFALWFLIISFVPIVLGTILEAVAGADSTKIKSLPKGLARFLFAFSAIANTKILFRLTDYNRATATTTKEDGGSKEESSADQEGGGQFQYIHGIRALASLTVMYVHTFALMMVPLNMKVSTYARYPNDMKETNRLFAVQPIFTASLIVQTFFSMSGMLLTYNALSPKLKIRFVPYVLLRWLRYTPPVLGTICLTMVAQLLGHGPLFHHDLIWPNVQRCYDSWWRNLLYINNFSDFNEQCGIHTWYLSAEMQLHVIGFLLLLAYCRSPNAAYLTSGGLVLGGLLIIGTIVASNLTPVSLFHIYTYTQYPVPVKAASLLYFMPWMQLPCYFVGAFVGQLLLEKRVLHLPRPLTTALSFLTGAIFLTYPFMTYPLIQQDRVLFTATNLPFALSYVALIVGWAFANAWFLYRLALSPTAPLTRFLSAKIWQPLSRLSFSLYLVHIVTIWYNSYQTRTTISFANINELHKLTSLTLVQSLFLAYLLYLTYEAPSVNLMKMLVKRPSPKEEVQSKSKQSTVAEEEDKSQKRKKVQ